MLLSFLITNERLIMCGVHMKIVYIRILIQKRGMEVVHSAKSKYNIACDVT